MVAGTLGSLIMIPRTVEHGVVSQMAAKLPDVVGGEDMVKG